MELPSMRVRDPAVDSGRGVTAGSAQTTSSSSSVEHFHVTFSDQSDSGVFSGSSTTKSDVEGFQHDLVPQRKQQPLLPSQQHLNPLFDVPDAANNSNSTSGNDSNKSSTDGSSSSAAVGNGGKGRNEGTVKSPPIPSPLVMPAVSSEKPPLGKRQSTKQLLKPKNALEVEVGSRDTVEKIAIRYRTTPSEICKMNKMASRMIFAGQVLFVPDPDASPVTPSPTREGPSVDLMFPSATTDETQRRQQQQKEGEEGANEECDLPKMPSLPSLPSFTSVSAITGGVTEASKDAGTAASSQISNLFSKLNPATAISRTSLRKKKSDSGLDKNGKGASADLDPDKECLERFLKLGAKYITDGRGVVSGTLLVTPNAIMFDPHVMDPLVKEHSPEEFGMMAPMECIMSATLYHDISRMSFGKERRGSSSALLPAYHADADTDEALLAVSSEVDKESTEQRLSVALGGKSTSSTPKLQRTGLKAADSKESSGSHDVASSSEGGVAKNQKDSASSSHIVKAETASSDLDDSVFESSSSFQKTGVSTASTASSSTPVKVLSKFGGDADYKELATSVHLDASNASPFQSTNAAVDNALQHPLTSSTPSNQRTAPKITETSQGNISRAPNGVETMASSRQPMDSSGTIINTVGSTVWYADLPTTTSTISKPSSGVSPTTTVHLEDAVDPRATERLFQPIPDILPSKSVENKVDSCSSPTSPPQTPLFLCLKVGQPLNKKVPTSGPIASYARKKKHPEYWFSIPKDRAPRLYAFFLQWTPEVYDNRDEQHQQAFVVLGNFEDGPEDEFVKQLQISREWEIVNTDEIERRRSFLSMLSMDESSLLPELHGESSIFDEELVKKLQTVLPARAVGYPWALTFSTEENGFSLKSLYRKMMATPQGPVLLFIKDTNDKIFGAMSSCTFVISDHFYGNGEMFLFSILDDGELKHWPWSGENSFFIKGNKESLAIGAGEGLFGLWLDEDLYHGRSHPCSTFGNECLSSKEDFVIKILEIWAFIS